MENALALSALLFPGGNTALWVIAGVLLVLYMLRRRSRKSREHEPLR